MPVQQIIAILAVAGGIVLAFLLVEFLSSQNSLDGIKARTVGDGQHGTARWAAPKEIRAAFRHVPFRTGDWRTGKNLPREQGLVLGCVGKKNAVTALVDNDDIH